MQYHDDDDGSDDSRSEETDALKKAFSKEVMSRVPSQSKYLDWLNKDHIVNIMTPN